MVLQSKHLIYLKEMKVILNIMGAFSLFVFGFYLGRKVEHGIGRQPITKKRLPINNTGNNEEKERIAGNILKAARRDSVTLL